MVEVPDSDVEKLWRVVGVRSVVQMNCESHSSMQMYIAPMWYLSAELTIGSASTLNWSKVLFSCRKGKS